MNDQLLIKKNCIIFSILRRHLSFSHFLFRARSVSLALQKMLRSYGTNMFHVLRKLSIFYQLALIILIIYVTKESFSLNVQENIPLEIITTSSKLVGTKNTTAVLKTYDEELKAFEKDYPKHRRKRFLYYNIESNLDVGYLVVIPITVVLPPMSNLFNKWRRRRRRSVESTEQPEPFEEHYLIQPHLDKISKYFELLDIPEFQCQLRAICEFSAEPYKYYPLSDIIIGRIRNPSIPTSILYDDTPSSHAQNFTLKSSTSIFQKYIDSADNGLAYGTTSCLKNYGSKCKYSIDKLLSMTALRVWSAMRSHIGFNIKDDFKI